MGKSKKLASSTLFKLYQREKKLVRGIKPEQVSCPKCGTKTMERDGADLHCWACGHTIYNVFTRGDLRPKPKVPCSAVIQAGSLSEIYAEMKLT